MLLKVTMAINMDMDQSDQALNQALNKVRDFIEKKDFAPDGRIPPERTLASELGLGRRSLRRALDVLEQEGHIHRHQGRGTFIDARAADDDEVTTAPNEDTATRRTLGAALNKVLDQTNPLEVIEMRLATEPVMASLAALRASQSEIKRLIMLAAKTRAASDEETYERADSLFHRTIAEAARSRSSTRCAPASATSAGVVWVRMPVVTSANRFMPTSMTPSPRPLLPGTGRRRVRKCSGICATCSNTYKNKRFRTRKSRSRSKLVTTSA
jgi:DNA-binding FadR family transcriptional regulator